MAQSFARFGSEVFLVETAHGILPREDREAAAIVQAAMLRDGVKLLCCGKDLKLARDPGGVRLQVESHGQGYDVAVDRLLVAVGRAVGRKHALELGLTGDPIPAATALDWGLVNRVVPDDDLDAAVADLLGRATRGSAASRALGKQAFYTQIGMDQPQAYAYAIEVMAAASQTPAAREGVASFLEKRPPVWD